MSRVSILFSLMPIKVHCFIFLCLFSTNSYAAGLYKCQTADGTITYQAQTCAGDSEPQKLRVSIPKSSPKHINDQPFVDEPLSGSLNEADVLVFRAKFVAALSSLTSIKMMVTEHYWSQGGWPKQVRDLDSAGGEMSNSRVDRVELGRQGEIHAFLSSEYGVSKQIVLQPQLVMAGADIEWRCLANFPAELLRGRQGSVCESRLIQ